MISLARAWNWLGGDLPGGPIPVLALLALYLFLLYKVIKPQGILRESSPLSWALAGLLVAVAMHSGLRLWAGYEQDSARLAVWTPDPVVDSQAFAQGLSMERRLRQLGRDRALKGWQLQLGEGLLQNHRLQPATALQADSLMSALRLRRLLQIRRGEAGLEWLLWERNCEVTDVRDTGYLDSPGDEGWNPFSDLVLPAGPVPDADLMPVLYASIADSAGRWLDLPEGHLPLGEDLRRARLMLELDASHPDIVRAVNRGLAAEDSAGAEGYLLAARWFMEKGEWESCTQALTNCLSIEPLHPELYWLISALNEDRLPSFGYHSRAEARARCLGLQPLHLPALHVQCQHWIDYRRGDLATDSADRALLVYPQDPEIRLLRGNLAYSLMEFGPARRHYEAVIELRPNEVRAWRNLGQLHYLTRDWAGAIEPLGRAVELGSPPEMLYLLGVCHRMNGNLPAAIDALRRRMKLGGSPEELERTRRQLAACFPDGVPESAE
jgi:tetratricopeptide (TPR) repeat protein